ncbi:hypothetical protein HDU89_000093 [Geranomyces variabilis]|nr:hypothetical protein HDU89_000093 [Geranomyces variabilis]
MSDVPPTADRPQHGFLLNEPPPEARGTPLTAGQAAFMQTRCEYWQSQLLDQSFRIRHLLAALAANKCAFNPKTDIKFETCAPNFGGGYGPKYGMVLCSNTLHEKQLVEDAITHELVHVYDYCTKPRGEAGMDIHQHACTEIRAASLSGDCKWTREVKRLGHRVGFSNVFERCVRRRATAAVQRHPDCRDADHAREVVDAVYTKCVEDIDPFTANQLLFS